MNYEKSEDSRQVPWLKTLLAINIIIPTSFLAIFKCDYLFLENDSRILRLRHVPNNRYVVNFAFFNTLV